MFLGKGVLKIRSKFTREHPCGSLISIKLQSNFIEITLRYGFSPVNLMHIFRTSFLKNTSGWLLLYYSNSKRHILSIMEKIIAFENVLLRKLHKLKEYEFRMTLLGTWNQNTESAKIHFINLSVIKQKGKSENRCFKKTKHAKYSEKRTFLTPWYTNISYPLIRTRVRISG